jgi:hypothetical protein
MFPQGLMAPEPADRFALINLLPAPKAWLLKHGCTFIEEPAAKEIIVIYPLGSIRKVEHLVSLEERRSVTLPDGSQTREVLGRTSLTNQLFCILTDEEKAELTQEERDTIKLSSRELAQVISDVQQDADLDLLRRKRLNREYPFTDQ